MKRNNLIKLMILLIIMLFLISIFILNYSYWSVAEEVQIIEVKDRSIIVENLSNDNVEIRTPKIVIKLIENQTHIINDKNKIAQRAIKALQQLAKKQDKPSE